MAFQDADARDGPVRSLNRDIDAEAVVKAGDDAQVVPATWFLFSALNRDRQSL
jgi:hypothetical protein